MPKPKIHTTWWIALPAVAIADGNVPECRVGDVLKFAVQFRPLDIRSAANKDQVEAIQVDRFIYDVTGKITQKYQEFTILDIGILVFGRMEVPENELIRGRISLSVDVFDEYTDNISEYIKLPMMHEWQVHEIWKANPPAGDAAGGSLMNPSYAKVESTNLELYGLWTDYCIVCNLRPVPASTYRPG